ncbi:MAG: hypothetical protein HY717_08680 [Planctomycetes bacterium]|nr:hypothetical protein [Planctomycetota bacterium]
MEIPTDDETEYEDENGKPIPGAAEFFGRLKVGDMVEVKDEADGNEFQIDVADEVEFEG